MEDTGEVKKIFAKEGLDKEFSSLFEMKVGYITTTEDYENAFKMDEVTDAVSRLEDSEGKQRLENILMYSDYPHIISLSGYNHLLDAAGLPWLELLRRRRKGDYE